MNLTAEAHTQFRSSAVQPGPVGLLLEGVTELLGRRRLVGYLAQADLKKKGADTLLGNLWWVIDPLLQMTVYVVLVSVIFNRGGPDYPLFIFCAILPWKWFYTSVMDGITSVTAAERLVRQIQFPKVVLPVAAVVAGIVNFAFGIIPLFGLILLFYRDRLSWTIVLIPIIAAVQFLFNMAVAIGLAAANVFYRDIGNLARHVIRLWFYLSPALYSVETLHKTAASLPVVGRLLLLNPFAVLFPAYRNVIYDGVPPDWRGLAEVAIGSVIVLAVMIVAFKRVEPAFAKVL